MAFLACVHKYLIIKAASASSARSDSGCTVKVVYVPTYMAWDGDVEPPAEDPHTPSSGTCLPWHPYQRCYLASLVGIHCGGLGSAIHAAHHVEGSQGLAPHAIAIPAAPAQIAVDGQSKPLDALVGVPKVGVGAKRGG